MLKIAKERLNELYAKINESMCLYLPIKAAGEVNYAVWGEGKEVSLETLKTVKSPKSAFFPQTENMMKFKTEEGNLQVIDVREKLSAKIEERPFVMFGVKACDYKAIEVLDKVFLADPVDTYYQNRREHGVIISTACSRPVETCFCNTFDIDMTKPEGDVRSYKTDDAYYFESLTEKGKKLLEKAQSILEESGNEAVEEQIAKTKEIAKKLPFHDLSKDAFGKDKTDEFFNSPAWDSLSESCLGCGTCTFVCPTCQCYDIKDFNTGHGVKRFRCWDSCMYSDFTKMSAGQPRLSQKERFRQRFMHKLVYYPTNNDGLFSCVGCGRCVAKCPISMNIVKVMKTLTEKEGK